jgi:hypothetical protein
MKGEVIETQHEVLNERVYGLVRDCNRKVVQAFCMISAIEYLLHTNLKPKTLRDFTPDYGIVDGDLAEVVELKILLGRIEHLNTELMHLRDRAMPDQAA